MGRGSGAGGGAGGCVASIGCGRCGAVVGDRSWSCCSGDTMVACACRRGVIGLACASTSVAGVGSRSIAGGAGGVPGAGAIAGGASGTGRVAGASGSRGSMGLVGLLLLVGLCAWDVAGQLLTCRSSKVSGTKFNSHSLCHTASDCEDGHPKHMPHQLWSWKHAMRAGTGQQAMLSHKVLHPKQVRFEIVETRMFWNPASPMKGYFTAANPIGDGNRQACRFLHATLIAAWMCSAFTICIISSSICKVAEQLYLWSCQQWMMCCWSCCGQCRCQCQCRCSLYQCWTSHTLWYQCLCQFQCSLCQCWMSHSLWYQCQCWRKHSLWCQCWMIHSLWYRRPGCPSSPCWPQCLAHSWQPSRLHPTICQGSGTAYRGFVIQASANTLRVLQGVTIP